jgi:glycine oxidase
MSTSSDVVVIGAGIIGCAVAHELTGRGLSVTMVDPRGAGFGATQASAGVLAPHIEGHDNAPLTALGMRSLAMYADFVAKVSGESGQTVMFSRTGTLETAFDEETVSSMRASAARLSASGVAASWLDAAETRAAEPQLSNDVRGALLVPEHGFVAATSLTVALAAVLRARGVNTVSGHTARVTSAAGRVRVETNFGAFEAANAVLAAGSWSGRIAVEGAPPVPVRPVRGQLLYLAWPGAPLRRVLWAPRCYLVPWSDGTLLVGATVEDAGFDERTTVAGVRDLLDAACDAVPRAWQAEFSGARVGLRPATPDELPIVGRSARVPGLVYATGHYRNGVLLTPLTAKIVGDLIADGREDPAMSTMTPARFGDL